MNPTVHVKLNNHARIKVKVGDEITSSTVLGEYTGLTKDEKICLSELLSVAPNKISKFLKLGIGEEVEAGQTVAIKKNLFSTSVVTSPLAGVVKEVNLKTGDLIISVKNEKLKNLTVPMPGKVKSVNPDGIDIEIKGNLYKGIKGEGKNTSGVLIYFAKEHLEVLDSLSQAQEGIVLCQTLDEDTGVKLEVVGARGLILRNLPKNLALPYVQVDEEVFKKIKSEKGNKAYLLPQEDEIVIV